jgi:hypothetical protein
MLNVHVTRCRLGSYRLLQRRPHSPHHAPSAETHPLSLRVMSNMMIGGFARLRQKHFRQHSDGIDRFLLKYHVVFMQSSVEVISIAELLTPDCLMLAKTFRLGLEVLTEHTPSFLRVTTAPGVIREGTECCPRFSSPTPSPPRITCADVIQHIPYGCLGTVGRSRRSLSNALRHLTLQVLTLQKLKTSFIRNSRL